MASLNKPQINIARIDTIFVFENNQCSAAERMGYFHLSSEKSIILQMYIEVENSNFCRSKSHTEVKNLGQSISCSPHFTTSVYLQSYYKQTARKFAPTD
jgi:hypothetical protein